jgi:hypothetical protein
MMTPPVTCQDPVPAFQEPGPLLPAAEGGFSCGPPRGLEASGAKTEPALPEPPEREQQSTGFEDRMKTMAVGDKIFGRTSAEPLRFSSEPTSSAASAASMSALFPKTQLREYAVRQAVSDGLGELRELLELIRSEQEALAARVDEALGRGADQAFAKSLQLGGGRCQRAGSPRSGCQRATSEPEPFSLATVPEWRRGDDAKMPHARSGKGKEPSGDRVMSFENLDDMYIDFLMKEGCGGESRGVSSWHHGREQQHPRAAGTPGASGSAQKAVSSDVGDSDRRRNVNGTPLQSSSLDTGFDGVCTALKPRHMQKRNLSPMTTARDYLTGGPASPFRKAKASSRSWATYYTQPQALVRKLSMDSTPDPADDEDGGPGGASQSASGDLADRAKSGAVPEVLGLPHTLEQEVAERRQLPEAKTDAAPQKSLKRRSSLSNVMDRLDIYRTGCDMDSLKCAEEAVCKSASLNRTDSFKLREAENVQDMEALRQKQEAVIIEGEYVPASAATDVRTQTSESTCSQSAVARFDRGPQRLLYVFGILRWQQGLAGLCYSSLVCLVTTCVVIYSALVTPWSPWRDSGDGESTYASLMDMCLAIGCLISLNSMRRKGIHRLLGRCADRPLEMIASKYGILEEWKRDSCRSFCVVAGFFCLEVTVRIWLTFADCTNIGNCPGTDRHEDEGILAPRNFPVFLFTSGLFAALVYCHLHLCCGLGWLVDQFYWELFRGLDGPKGTRKWSVVQAFLRNAATTMETSFVAILTSVLLSLLLVGADTIFTIRHEEFTLKHRVRNGLLPVLPKLVLTFYSCYRAAQVTERCKKAPALVNMVISGPQALDWERAERLQNVVQYIAQSDAGFYIFSKRLDMSTVWKWIYIVGLFMFYFVTYSR